MKNDPLSYNFMHRSPDGLKDEELLELLLRYSRDDAGEMARKILERFPNIAVIMEADAEDLSTVEGMDEDTVLLLRLIPELHRRYFLSRSRAQKRLTDSRDYGNYLQPYFYGARDEMVYLLLLAKGSVNATGVPIRRLVQEALTANATGIVLAHNHPCGIALPSKEDVELTLRLREALEIMDLTLLDHIIVADDDFVSLRDSGYLHRF